MSVLASVFLTAIGLLFSSAERAGMTGFVMALTVPWLWLWFVRYLVRRGFDKSTRPPSLQPLTSLRDSEGQVCALEGTLRTPGEIFTEMNGSSQSLRSSKIDSLALEVGEESVVLIGEVHCLVGSQETWRFGRRRATLQDGDHVRVFGILVSEEEPGQSYRAHELDYQLKPAGTYLLPNLQAVFLGERKITYAKRSLAVWWLTGLLVISPIFFLIAFFGSVALN